MSLPMPDMLSADGWALDRDGQARTSTIWPLKISSAFRISGSFLKSSLLVGTDPGFALVGGAAVSWPVLAGEDVAPAGGGWITDSGASGAGATRFAGSSALTNLTCASGNPNSLSLV